MTCVHGQPTEPNPHANKPNQHNFSFCSGPCPDPGRLLNGKIIGDDFGIGKEVKFKCDIRYYRTGPRSLTCLGRGWDKKFPTCNGKWVGSHSEVQRAQKQTCWLKKWKNDYHYTTPLVTYKYTILVKSKWYTQFAVSLSPLVRWRKRLFFQNLALLQGGHFEHTDYHDFWPGLQ